jgi:hypothetical protein
MRRFLVLLLACVFPALSFAQTLPVPDSPPSSSDDGKAASQPLSPAAMQHAMDLLTQSNHDLLDLLKQQQAVLEDIQYDRRLQSRQIQLVEERLTDCLTENAKLQAKIATLEATASAPPANPPPATTAVAPVAQTTEAPPPTPDQPPPPPASYLPAPEAQGAPGTKYWHRLFTLSGTDSKTSDVFHVQGATWRVFWHNLDKPGDSYANTSALFINAFPRDDTIPQKVCAKLGTGGDSAELIGPGNYYLKIEASGGSWELAVEDYY